MDSIWKFNSEKENKHHFVHWYTMYHLCVVQSIGLIELGLKEKPLYSFWFPFNCWTPLVTIRGAYCIYPCSLGSMFWPAILIYQNTDTSTDRQEGVDTDYQAGWQPSSQTAFPNTGPPSLKLLTFVFVSSSDSCLIVLHHLPPCSINTRSNYVRVLLMLLLLWGNNNHDNQDNDSLPAKRTWHKWQWLGQNISQIICSGRSQ